MGGRILWTNFIGPILAFLPLRLRTRWWPDSPIEWKCATVVSGILEALLSLITLGFWHFAYFAFLAEKFVTARDAPGSSFRYGWEPVRQAGLFAFALHPITWTVVYFGCEGIVRALDALTEQRSYGIFPLTAADSIYYALARPRPIVELPLVCDEMTPGHGNFDLQISSCRRRPTWKYPFTIRYSGTYFQVVGESHLAAGPRPHLHQLRRLPPGEIARGLKDYDPNDILARASG